MNILNINSTKSEFGIVQLFFNFGYRLGPIIGGVIYNAFINFEFNIGDIIYLELGSSLRVLELYPLWVVFFY